MKRKILGSILTLFGLVYLIYEYNLYKKLKALKAGIDTDAPVYNFVFDINKDKSRPMTIYEASLKKGERLDFYITQMRIAGLMSIVGISILILGNND